MLSQSEAKPPPAAPVVTGDYGEKKLRIIGEKKSFVVTGDYRKENRPNSKIYRKLKKRSAKPKIEGCEVRKYESGWNVFRFWYDAKQPGEKWPKKHRAYEGYLTQDDIERAKEIKSNGSKKKSKKVTSR